MSPNTVNPFKSVGFVLKAGKARPEPSAVAEAMADRRPAKLAPTQSTGLVPAALGAAAILFFLTAGSSVALAQATPPALAKGASTLTLTMADAIHMALTNNLDIRISQIAPMVDQFALNGLYEAYDPAFNFSAVRNISVSPGGNTLADTPIAIPPNTATFESYSAGLSGALPSGLTYNLSSPLQWQQYSAGQGAYSYYSSTAGITLTQPLLKNSWLNAPRYNISLAKKTLRIDQLALRFQIMTVINNVKAAYYNLVYSRENVRVQVAALQLAQQLVQENKKKVQFGALAPLDEKQAESQAATSQADLLVAQGAQAVQENVLKNLLSSTVSQWTGFTPVPAEPLVAVPEAVDLMESWRKGVELRPDLLQVKLTIEKQHVTLKYDFNQLFPEVDLTGSYGHNATAATFSDNLDVLGHGHFPFYSYGVVMTVPLANLGTRNTYKSAKATLQQDLLQLKKTEQQIISAIDTDIKNIHAGLLRVEATRRARIYAEDALEAEQTKLEHGKSTSFIVLQLQSNLTAARSAEIRALADYNIYLEQLSFDDGTTLERNRMLINGN